MSGPPKKPYLYQVAAGNPSHRPLNKGPEFKPGKTTPPRHLKNEARALWKKLVGEMAGLDLWKEVYRPAFEGLCMNYQRALDAGRAISTGGMTFMTENGYEVQRPQVAIEQKSWQAVRMFCSEFGLTLSSTGKIVVPLKPKKSLKELLA